MLTTIFNEKTNGLRDCWDKLTFEITRKKQSLRKTNQYIKLVKATFFSNNNYSTRSNMRDKVSFFFSLRLLSALSLITKTQKEMNDIKNLQLSLNKKKVMISRQTNHWLYHSSISWNEKQWQSLIFQIFFQYC